MKAFFAAAAIAALPLAAQAATVGVAVIEYAEGRYYGSGSATTREDVTFEFVIAAALDDFTVALSGSGRLLNATFGYALPGGAPVTITSPFTSIFNIGRFGPGTYSVAYDFTGTPLLPLSVTATVFGNLPPVPVPPAAALAMSGVLALGILKARRSNG